MPVITSLKTYIAPSILLTLHIWAHLNSSVLAYIRLVSIYIYLFASAKRKESYANCTNVEGEVQQHPVVRYCATVSSSELPAEDQYASLHTSLHLSASKVALEKRAKSKT